MATWTAATAIPTGQLITSAWMSNVAGAINFLGASGSSTGKDLFFARQTVAQALDFTGGAYVALTFTTEDIDVANGHSTSSQFSRYTAQAAGKYRLSGSISVPQNVAAQQMVGAFYKNGAVISSGAKASFYVGSYATTEQCFVMPNVYLTLATTDYVELRVTKGTNFTTEVSAGQSTFGVEWVGA